MSNPPELTQNDFDGDAIKKIVLHLADLIEARKTDSPEAVATMRQLGDLLGNISTRFAVTGIWQALETIFFEKREGRRLERS